MKIVSIVLFALITAFSSIIAFLYIDRKVKKDDETNEESNNCKKNLIITDKKTAKVVTICAFTVTSLLIGLFIYERTTSLLSYYKIVMIFSLTTIIALTDLELKLIPNVFVLSLLGGGLIFHIVDAFALNAGNGDRLKQILFYNVIAAIVVVIFLCIVSTITHSGMGFGDIKYLGAMCFAGGITLLLISVMVSLICSLVYGLIGVFTKKKKMKDTVPFGPFIMIGLLVCLFTGLM